MAPKLRILINADAKDWRSHLEEVQQHTKVCLAPANAHKSCHPHAVHLQPLRCIGRHTHAPPLSCLVAANMLQHFLPHIEWLLHTIHSLVHLGC